MKFSYYIWALYLIVYPFYFFDQGNPQLAEVFGLILIGFNFKNILLGIKYNRLTKFLFFFIIYTLIVNTIWLLFLHDPMILKNSMFYIYSFFMFLFVLSKIKNHDFLEFTLKAIGVMLIIQLLLWPFVGDQGSRTQMFFKNPNQLAFWSICILMISYIITTIIKPKIIYTYGILLLCTFFAFISASKGAIGGCVLFWGYFFIRSKKQLLIVATIGIIGSLFFTDFENFDIKNISTINNVVERLTEKKSSGHEGFEGRGYDRIYNYPQYLFFGAGEGHTERFNATIELHSTFFSILFCYGLIGLVLFLTALTSIFKNTNKQVLILLFILVAYTLAHMTLRAPLFWITILFIFYLKEHMHAEKNQLLEHE